jgi:hypothetical protein
MGSFETRQEEASGAIDAAGEELVAHARLAGALEGVTWRSFDGAQTPGPRPRLDDVRRGQRERFTPRDRPKARRGAIEALP